MEFYGAAILMAQSPLNVSEKIYTFHESWQESYATAVPCKCGVCCVIPEYYHYSSDAKF
jgi:hypothetical protein